MKKNKLNGLMVSLFTLCIISFGILNITIGKQLARRVQGSPEIVKANETVPFLN